MVAMLVDWFGWAIGFGLVWFGLFGLVGWLVAWLAKGFACSTPPNCEGATSAPKRREPQNLVHVPQISFRRPKEKPVGTDLACVDSSEVRNLLLPTNVTFPQLQSPLSGDLRHESN